MNLSLGFFLIVLAGAMNGSFTAPMKFTKKWAWENTWLAWTLWALFIFPIALTFATIPRLGDVYNSAGMKYAIMAAAFGAGWGISQVFLGLAVAGIGMALSFSVILGLSAAVGSLLPLLQQHRDQAFTPGGLTIIAGVVLVLIGVGICAIAGHKRERIHKKTRTAAEAEGRVSIGKGLLFATISGLGSALVGLGLAYGKPIQDAAVQLGADTIWAPNGVWLPLMIAGGIPNLLYCIYLMKKNRTGAKQTAPGTGHYWFLACLMAIGWFGSTVMYGVSTTMLGHLGAIVGWPMFMSLIVIAATAWGIATGEWKGVGRGPLMTLLAGVGVLVIAIVVLAQASTMLKG